jgi:Family of unknown function (DUF6521)
MVWIDSNPLVQSRVAERTRLLLQFTKEALMFGGRHSLLEFHVSAITANPDLKKPIATDLKDSTDEVRDCMKRAEFLGRWLGSSGTSSTVMALLGIRP